MLFLMPAIRTIPYVISRNRISDPLSFPGFLVCFHTHNISWDDPLVKKRIINYW